MKDELKLVARYFIHAGLDDRKEMTLKLIWFLFVSMFSRRFILVQTGDKLVRVASYQVQLV